VGRDLGDGFGPVWIQQQSTINAGNSGGPFLDLEGHVVGVNNLSMDQLASGQSVQGIFFAIPAKLAQSTAARLSVQIQRPTTTLLRATQPRASRLGTAFYILTLPAGWISHRPSRSQPVLISRDQLVQVQLGTRAIRQRPSTAGLHQMISRMASKVGRVKSLTFSAVTVGRLHGVSGTATYARKPYRLVVVTLPEHSGKHVFVLAAIVHSRATAKDKQQYKAVVASLRPMR
jgi:hypothetical protein